MIKKFVVTIKGERWTVLLFSFKEFRKIWPKTWAVCHYDHGAKYRTLQFCNKHLDLDTIIHEITHAYLSYTDFSKMSYGQMEEKICEINGKNMRKMLKLADRLRIKLRAKL